MKKTTTVCDLCKIEFVANQDYPEHSLADSKVFGDRHGWQKFGEADICAGCCRTLRWAERLGLVFMNWSEILARSGYEQTEAGVFKNGKILVEFVTSTGDR